MHVELPNQVDLFIYNNNNNNRSDNHACTYIYKLFFNKKQNDLFS